MKTKTVLAVVLSIVAVSATAQVHVNGYVKKDGTYVAPHERTAPNNTTSDNYSTKGNVNPYTGKEGTKDPSTNPYQSVQPAQPQPLQPIQPVQPPQPFGTPQAPRKF